MKHFIYFCFLFVFAACNLDKIEEGALACPAAKFSTSVGGSKFEAPTDVLATDDCGFVVCGISQSFTTDYQAYFVKVDDKGVQQWERSYGSDKYDEMAAVIAAKDGGYVLCGFSAGFGQDKYYDIYLIKTESNGVESWSRTFEFDGFTASGVGIVQTSDGTYRIAYNKADTLGGNNQIGILQVDANGTKISDKIITSPENRYASAFKSAADGGFIIAGSSSPSTGTKTLIIKLDASGNRVWEKTFDDPAGGSFLPAYDVAAQNNYAVAGSLLGTNDHDFNVLLYDASGGLTWSKSFGSVSADEALDITFATDGDIVVTGYTSGFSTNSEVYLLKLSKTNGSTVWEKHFGNRQGYDVCIDNAKDGGFIVAATGQKTAGNTDIFLYKTDKDGNF